MKSYKFNDTQTGFVSIPGDTEIIVAHYEDGHEETIDVFSFVMDRKKRHQCIMIDCYRKGEKIIEKGGKQ